MCNGGIKITKELYVTTCGRVFQKNGTRRTIKSFETRPILKHRLNKFCKVNSLKQEDFTQIKLFDDGRGLYKYKIDTHDLFERKPCKSKQGYMVSSNKKIHRLVLETHKSIENSHLYQVNHIDGNKENNSIVNLEWCTAKENIRHAIKLGLHKNHHGHKIRESHMSKMSLNDVLDINCKKTKKHIKDFLERRNINFELYDFIKTSKNKTNHALGYVKLKTQ